MWWTKKRRKPGKRKRRKTSGRRSSRWHQAGWFARRRWTWLALLLVALGLPATGYVVYLDDTVRSQFEGKRWALPARVYARPLELYPDSRLSADAFVDELRLLGYRAVSRPNSPGTYNRRGGVFVMTSRPFQFWDGREEAQSLRLEFSRGRLLGLWSAGSGEPLDLLRLDPPQIGSIYPSHNEDRILVKLEQVPPLLIEALLTVEDRGFYQHHGVSPRSILRALLANLRAGRTVQGGSTLTQQLVKNFFLTNQRTLTRKINEAIMALLLEWHYQKDEILEAYVNEIYLGQDGRRAIHGFGLASQFYFEKPLSKLNTQEVALLVALVKGPSYYDPRRQSQRARERRDLVLEQLLAQGFLSEQAAQQATDAPLGVTARRHSGVTRVPAFMGVVRRQLRRDYSDEDLRSEGLRIFTTLDPVTQAATEKAVSTQLAQLGRAGNDREIQVAAVVADVANGELLAVVGGRDPHFAGFNRALDAVRPIGSLIKPAVYLTALMRPDEYTLATPLSDGPLDVDLGGGERWQPQNFDHKDHGQVLLRDALVHSYNRSTARLGLELGVPAVIDTLRALGVRRPLTEYPALLLGAANLSPLDVTQMYHTFAAEGFQTPLRAIRAVLTADGEPLARYPLEVNAAIDSLPVSLLNTALRAVTREGTAHSVYRQLPDNIIVAGKTGTTDDLRDSWFAGFGADKLAVVWLGLDDNKPAGLTGASGALRVWGDLMARIGVHSLPPGPPPLTQIQWVDRSTGQRVEEDCPHGLPLPFIPGTIPVGETPCDWDGANED